MAKAFNVLCSGIYCSARVKTLLVAPPRVDFLISQEIIKIIWEIEESYGHRTKSLAY